MEQQKTTSERPKITEEEKAEEERGRAARIERKLALGAITDSGWRGVTDQILTESAYARSTGKPRGGL